MAKFNIKALQKKFFMGSIKSSDQWVTFGDPIISMKKGHREGSVITPTKTPFLDKISLPAFYAIVGILNI